MVGLSTYRFRHLLVVILLIAFFGLGAALWNLSFAERPFLTVALQGVLGFVEFCIVGVFHDLGHGTFFRSQRANLFLGRLLAPMLLVPFGAYRATHRVHHKAPLAPGDWEFWPHCSPETTRFFRVRFGWLELLAGRLTNAWIYSRIFWNQDSPLKGQIRRTIGLEYGVCVLFWAAVFLYVHYYASWGGFVRVALVPSWIAGSLQSLNRMMEHLGQPVGDGNQNTRTAVFANPIERFLSMLTLQSSHGGPHHDQPRIAPIDVDEWYRTHSERYTNFFPSYAAVIKDALGTLIRNPDSGVLSPKYKRVHGETRSPRTLEHPTAGLLP